MGRLAIVALGLLAACGTVPVRPPSSGGATGAVVAAADPAACGADARQTLVGQPATALERVLILGQVRLLRPGRDDPGVPRPGRITFEIGPDERIARVFCG